MPQMNRRIWFPFSILALLLLGAGFLRFHRGRAHRAKGNQASIFSSSIGSSRGLVGDAEGNLYLNEPNENRILKISSDRQVAVFAGDGQGGYSGDGGPADQARLASPTGIAVDPVGNLFIADTGNNAIRRVDAKTAIITTIPGNYFQGEWIGEVAKYSGESSGTYPPISIAVDGEGNLYLGVSHAGGIKRIDPVNQNVTSLVGPGLNGDPSAPVAILGPYWMAVDRHGTLFFSDPDRNLVSQVNFPGKDVHRIAGGGLCDFGGDGGSAVGALLCFPEALVVNNDQKLFFLDAGNNRVRQIDLTTGIIFTVAGNGQTGYQGDNGLGVSASFNTPTGLAVDGEGNLYIADTGNKCIRRLDAKSGILTTWASDRDLQLSIDQQK
jgi:sugar lactone lactonase YvrE